MNEKTVNSRGASTRKRILEVSIQAFAQRGYVGTSLDSIAGELGITRQAVLFHFKDKVRLYDAAVESLLESAALAARRRQREDFDSLSDYVAHLVASAVDFQFALPEFSRMTVYFLLSPAPSAEEPVSSVSGMVAQWQEVLEEGRRTGQTRDVPLQSVIALVGGMLAYYFLLPGGRQASSALPQYDPRQGGGPEAITADLNCAVRGLLGLPPAG